MILDEYEVEVGMMMPNNTRLWECLRSYLAAGAYGKAGNGSGMETGNGKWKWKLEMEI